MEPQIARMIQEAFMMVIAGGTIALVAYSPLPRSIGQAIAHRLMHGRTQGQGSTPLPDPRLDDLLDDNALLRRQLDEMSNRLEFTERMMAQAKEKGLLNAPRGNG